MLHQPAAKEAGVVPAPWKSLVPQHAIPGGRELFEAIRGTGVQLLKGLREGKCMPFPLASLSQPPDRSGSLLPNP